MERTTLTPSLLAPDLPTTLAFYTGVLGFEVSGRWDQNGEPVWAEVQRQGPAGTARIWFFSSAIGDRPGPALSGLLYFFLGSVDALAGELAGRVTVRWGPETQPYGLRELAIEDCNGYLLCFAEDVAAG